MQGTQVVAPGNGRLSLSGLAQCLLTADGESAWSMSEDLETGYLSAPVSNVGIICTSAFGTTVALSLKPVNEPQGDKTGT